MSKMYHSHFVQLGKHSMKFSEYTDNIMLSIWENWYLRIR